MILAGNAPQQPPLDQHAEGADQQRSQHQRDPVVDAQVVEAEHRGEGAEHVLRAMGEVDDPQQAEDDRQAQAEQGIERPVDQAQEQLAEQHAQGNAE
ncbi:hypothetical protein D9M70_629460 [compost metagenome]